MNARKAKLFVIRELLIEMRLFGSLVFDEQITVNDLYQYSITSSEALSSSKGRRRILQCSITPVLGHYRGRMG